MQLTTGAKMHPVRFIDPKYEEFVRSETGPGPSPELADTSDITPSLDGHPETSVASSRIEWSGGAQRSKR